ncbi:unnamed protein product [Kuraishia capsulata CBS 1993]|uniref:GDP-mannose transporter n=1 Tax=Kuraishia capsulata CBS 1993 TaxID=1382522 RepID=W6MP14_9ASCO|nr:uncharacterized protein KUCA_T00002786001 [Kuraishia capsulata CBS 1993]CDK26812.1 unnamed protein product [Kuraishia capsulata CBS 1993]
MFGPNLNFHYPILITSCHQLILFTLSLACVFCFPHFRLGAKESYWMDLKTYCYKILPCSVSSAGDIGLGNTSFKFITLSLYTMIKSSSLVFVLLWGVVFKLEHLSLRLVCIVLVMTFGVVMMVWGQKDQEQPIVPGGAADDSGNSDTSRMALRARGLDIQSELFIGCLLVLMSSCMSGLRWALTQILLKKNRYTKNPILTILYISPSMFLLLFLIGCGVEGLGNFLASEIWAQKGVPFTILLLIIPGLLAFAMTLSEFILLSHASLLTLSIAGIFKELLTILLGFLIFGDKLSLINIFGLAITLGDIMWYNYFRLNEEDPKHYEEYQLVGVDEHQRERERD